MSRFTVRVQPGARRSGIVGRMADGTFKLAVTEPAERGRANDAVVECLARALGVAKGSVRIAAGGGSRGKLIEVDGLEWAAIERRLAAALAAAE